MKKKYKCEVDCANCAAKMEDAVSRIDGVNSVSVSSLMQKFVLDAADDRYDEILDEAIRACKKVEPDCVIEV